MHPLEALYRGNRPGYLKVAWRYLRNHADAEEVVQDAFLAAWRRWPQFRGDNPTSWVWSILVNACLDRLRRDKSRRIPEQVPLDGAHIPVADPILERIEARERKTQVARLIVRLPMEQREAIAAALEGQVLATTPKVRRFRAIRTLRYEIELAHLCHRPKNH